MNNQNHPPFNQTLNINTLLQENIKLKKQIQSFQKKEKLYQSSIANMKKFQAQYQQTFIKAMKDYKNHEEQIKNTYINYQKLIDKHYKENENRFIEENTKLNMELKEKNILIKILNNKIRLLNRKLNKMENDFQFENRKLESEVVSKERKLSELNESMIQLARNTNDEIKLLRDEFEIFNKMKKKNKRYQSFQKNEDFDNNSLMMEHSFGNNAFRIKRKLYDKEEYKDDAEDIDFLVNKVHLLEKRNKNLSMELKRKEEELSICNKLKNELLYDNNNEKYFHSNQNDKNKFQISRINDKNIKFQRSSNNIKNYRNKKSNLRNKSNKTQNEAYEPYDEFRNNLNKNYSLFKEKNNDINEINLNDFQNDNKYLNDYDINELVITSNQNNFQNFMGLDDNNIIKDEYLNSKLPKINTLE